MIRVLLLSEARFDGGRQLGARHIGQQAVNDCEPKRLLMKRSRT